ncbi:LPS assembly lipoprotein LptE [Hafnia alvei]|uniref:LPS-assembly lipoprotein LptE n=3 Tax=Hafnia alvei TaxID=569 RepID=A0A097R032_HAFAL|nr:MULTISPECIES: LPS assembly lipoprotein LptE [Hafnia]MDN5970709.1 LPS assembly lipoprotein LptE [Enterobacterales bacterium]AIU72087.1 lipoprotein [Hafnia alvei FB1]AWV44104.1 LPS assembly lipoprotein LptE [Hafnia alvei]KFC87926.1 LPS assembly lipoprotein [Hafnia alvei ATCC 13337]KID02565.2 lipoprotein [Hafnia alvei]
MRHRTMTSLLKVAVLGLAVLTAGCGFHLRGNTSVPTEFQKITFDTSDPYGPLSRSIREQLRLSGITIVDPKVDDSKTTDATTTSSASIVDNSATAAKPADGSDKLPSLRIVGSSESKETVSIFKDGKTAEYQMVLNVNAQVLVRGHDLYPLTVRVYRSFFDNPLTALAKDAEQEMIRQEMRDQAAQQLVRKLLSVHAAELQNNDNRMNAEVAAPKVQSANDFNSVNTGATVPTTAIKSTGSISAQ